MKMTNQLIADASDILVKIGLLIVYDAYDDSVNVNQLMTNSSVTSSDKNSSSVWFLKSPA